jgi:hypothetical protein
VEPARKLLPFILLTASTSTAPAPYGDMARLALGRQGITVIHDNAESDDATAAQNTALRASF